MARPKIKDRGEIKKMVTISIESKYLEGKDIEEVKKTAYNSIVMGYLFHSPKKHVESEKHKTIN